MFSTLWKSFTFTSNITSEGLFHWKVVCFFLSSVYWEKRKQFSPFSLPQGSSVKTFQRGKAILHPLPVTAALKWHMGREGRGQMQETKQKETGKPGRKDEVQKTEDLVLCTANWVCQPSGKQVQEGTAPLLEALLGTGWVREGQKQKTFLLSPQHITCPVFLICEDGSPQAALW